MNLRQCIRQVKHGAHRWQDTSQGNYIIYTCMGLKADVDESELTAEQYWQLENVLADCYPLPDFRQSYTLFGYSSEDIPHQRSKASTVPDQDFPLWLAEWAQHKSLGSLLSSDKLSDLRRLYKLLETTHSRLHQMIDTAARDSGAVGVGAYLSLTLMHAGVESLMQQTLVKLGKHLP